MSHSLYSLLLLSLQFVADLSSPIILQFLLSLSLFLLVHESPLSFSLHLISNPFSSSNPKTIASFKPSIPLNTDSSPSRRPYGKVHVIMGPMFTGKTTSLLCRIKSEGASDRNLAMMKSSKDNKYAIDSVVTHDGAKFSCWALPDLSLFRHRFGGDASEKLDVVGIHEAQFFDDLYDFCCTVSDHDGKTVIVAGLDGDYLRT
ncbi:thymidine kinase a-like [Argentina anserina]|uniref:thymidine kinase a-like n=1 Tax=Argentina anserina TaxID=57926 RepID=UPI00217637E8|nr:thymidine kinase a-like [Potentilla anserina]